MHRHHRKPGAPHVWVRRRCALEILGLKYARKVLEAYLSQFPNNEAPSPAPCAGAGKQELIIGVIEKQQEDRSEEEQQLLDRFDT
jgi:hypothetical protein